MFIILLNSGANEVCLPALRIGKSFSNLSLSIYFIISNFYKLLRTAFFILCIN